MTIIFLSWLRISYTQTNLNNKLKKQTFYDRKYNLDKLKISGDKEIVFRIEVYSKYEPVTIEKKTVTVRNLTVAYRQAFNADPDFYNKIGEKIPVIFLHGPDWQSETWEWLGTVRISNFLIHFLINNRKFLLKVILIIIFEIL